jgi:aminoglycoside 3-N-acetyltransferase
VRTPSEERDLSLDDIIRRSNRPYTRASLAADLAELGVVPGGIVIAHTALSAIGYVSGGAVALLEALGDALGPEGTLVMPAQSADLSDPAIWHSPSVPGDWVDTIRETMPAYDPARTPTWKLGVVAELFRTWPGVQRSAHPVCSFAARGPLAREILEPHELDDPFGETSPLARLYRRDARILLIGANWEACTSFHLAERRAQPDAEPEESWAPVMIDGKRVWAPWREYPHANTMFPFLGVAMQRAGIVRRSQIGEAPGRLTPLRAAVDFAVARLTDRR